MAAPLRPRIGLGERISNAVTDAMRSWHFLVLLVAWTAWWWAQGWPFQGWFVTHIRDPFPFPFWNVIVSLLTVLDIVVFGIRQLRQDATAAEMARAMRAQNEAILTLLGEVRDVLRDARTMNGLPPERRPNRRDRQRREREG